MVLADFRLRISYNNWYVKYMEKITSRQKLEEKIQDEIYSNMSVDKKVRLTFQFFKLVKKLQEAETIYYNDIGIFLEVFNKMGRKLKKEGIVN